MLEDVNYQSTSTEFWNACVAICDERDYRIGGTFFDGKGQPGQASAVFHGSPTGRFNGVKMINSSQEIDRTETQSCSSSIASGSANRVDRLSADWNMKRWGVVPISARS